uniref:Uncharacterized protein n=1 Tax=Cannabis sativa TaxID=3483 RepID=A0A803PT49_CANSA
MSPLDTLPISHPNPATAGEVRPDTPFEVEDEDAARRLPFGGFNEDGQPVFEVGKILEAGEDYVTKEYTDAVPQRRQGAVGPQWVSPPSIVT